jgi:hypothetical protein
MISRSQMNRQLYQMGGEGMQAGMQEGIMQMAPQEMQPQMQQMDAEQYRPVAEQLAQDPNQALMAIVRMLMEQGIPEEEAIKIAKQMIQAVAEGGIEEVSDDTRVEARFGGRIGYAEGGISRLVNREQYGFGSIGKVFKGAAKAVTGAVKGVASAVKSVAKSPIGRMALTIGAMYALGPAGLNIGSGMGAITGGALRAGIANLAVQAASGQKINFGEALTAGALGGITGGLTQGGTFDGTEGVFNTSTSGGFDGTEGLFNTSTYGGLENLTLPTASSGFPQTTPGGFGMDTISYTPTPPAETSFLGSIKDYGTKALDYVGSAYDKGIDYIKENPKTALAGAALLGASAGAQPPEQQPGESIEEYRARVAEFERQYASNLAGRTGPSLPASARNPFYPVYAARGGRIGYLFGGSGVASAVAQPVEGQSMPVSGGGKGIGGMLRNLIANNPEIFKQVTSEQTMSPMQRSSGPIPLGLVDYSGTPYENAIKKKSVAQPTIGGSTYSSGGGFGGLNMGSDLIKQITQQSFFNTNEDEEDTRYKLPASARNPFYGVMMANGGRMRYAMGNSVEEGIMAAPQIASQMGMPVGNPRMNEGGVPELDYRDEGGFVPPIGIKERADDIPAMLSNNEFVFTADAVKNAGGGDPNIGAQKMYTLMKRLESGGRV